MNALPLFSAVAILVAQGTLAQAQSTVGNTLFVEQNGQFNQLQTDQSRAIGSTFGSAENRITQIGEGNQLEIIDRGAGNTIARATQDNTVNGIAFSPNTASILLGETVSDAQVQLSQSIGGNALLGNDATIQLLNGSAASVVQNGGGNIANLTVNGLGASGAIEQIGDRNTGTLTVTNANVSLSQQGSDLTNALSSTGLAGLPAGITVESNGATVNIVQTSNLPPSR